MYHVGSVEPGTIQLPGNQAAKAGWSEPYTYILLVVGIGLFVALTYVETHGAQWLPVPINSLTNDVCVRLCVIDLAPFGILSFYL